MFYAAVLPLLAYYGLFATVLYPIAGALHPVDLVHSLMPSVPTGARPPLGLLPRRGPARRAGALGRLRAACCAPLPARPDPPRPALPPLPC